MAQIASLLQNGISVVVDATSLGEKVVDPRLDYHLGIGAVQAGAS
jgi:hypothetical protein